MRAVVQRVAKASVTVKDQTIGKIDRGVLVLLGIGKQDTNRDIAYMADKIAGLRIFEDGEGKMNRSVADIQGSILVVSQFTVYGDVKKGKRPSWSDAAEPAMAKDFYERFVKQLESMRLPVATGQFAASMQVSLVNDGPVTILIDSNKIV